MKMPSQSNWFSGLLALLFALLLFFNANSSNNSTTSSTSFQVYDEVLDNIPIQLEYDQDKYFVSGYEEVVNVHLSSANRIQLNAQANENTRTFQVVADLTQVGLGTTEVPLRVKGLSSAVSAELEPKTITVTVEKKVTRAFEVQAQLPGSIEADGYKVEKVNVSPKTVEITTGEETAKAITQVIAPLSNVKQSAETIKQTVNVQALDAKGQALSIENPAPQVKVVVDLALPSKEVGLTISATGSPPADIDHYTFSLSEAKAEIRGSKSVLDTIDTIEVPVDISSIRTTTKKTVEIPINGDYIVTPEKVTVTINPVLTTTRSSYSDNGGQSSTLSNNNQRPTNSGSSDKKTDGSTATSSSTGKSTSSSSAKQEVDDTANE
jgi:YbbR domain-containing protein